MTFISKFLSKKDQINLDLDDNIIVNNKYSNKQILQLVDKDKQDDKLYIDFVKRFLRYIPTDYFKISKMRFFKDILLECFNFILLRKHDDFNVEISKCKFENNPAITILLNVNNKPFIIDSLNLLFDKLGLDKAFLLHPVIYIKRDKDGKILDIINNYKNINSNSSDTDKSTKDYSDYTAESLICVKALGIFTDKEIENIKNQIINILNIVDKTNDSWHILLDKMQDIIKINNNIKDVKKYDVKESGDFLHWLYNDNFTFLAAIDFQLDNNKITSKLGVLEVIDGLDVEINHIIASSMSEYYENKLIMLGKINKLSNIHIDSLFDYVLVKNINDKGQYKSGTIIFGLYGKDIYYKSIETIPFLRKKRNYVLHHSRFPLNGYNVKKLENIIESLPREILIQISDNDLYMMSFDILSSMISGNLKFFLFKEQTNNLVNILLFMKRDNLTPEIHKNINKYLSKNIGNNILNNNITVIAQNFVYIFITISPEEGTSDNDLDLVSIEKNLIKITTNWQEELLSRLCKKKGAYEGMEEYQKIKDSFSAKYQYNFSVKNALNDIEYLKIINKTHRKSFNLLNKSQGKYELKIYSPFKEIDLSDILPMIENIGFHVISEQMVKIDKSAANPKSFLYIFNLFNNTDSQIDFNILKANIEEALGYLDLDIVTNDKLNKLLINTLLTSRQVQILRAFTKYLNQTDFIYGQDYAQDILIKHYEFSSLIILLFDKKFNPESVKSIQEEEKLDEKILKYLSKLKIIAEDVTLRSIYKILKAIVRTNYYQKISDNQSSKDKNQLCFKQYLSFKIDSKKLDLLPLPRPYFEIFVYSKDFEGVHLRGAKIARGGIRWSDRREDYRTEVLGLMKAQMTKNTVIVPAGSKGGFVVNFTADDNDDYMKKVIASYQDFLRGLLDLTDNIITDQESDSHLDNISIVKPQDTVILDEDDSYLVVAADKGTASFSDYANQISKEYNFWLRDAFASGGSAGYDHKKMGITAKGAWISVQLHFARQLINVQKDSITVVGIGDMSGDVFGNGMLLSDKIKLVAAFNHRYIFIDPNPDPKISFKERKRLFETPKTMWSDYDSKLISKGGGVYSRKDKMIILSKEAIKLLDIENLERNEFTPNEVINLILKAPCDLLWNGGIGTYIKSSKETHFDIGDKANDALRVNGNEARFKILGEGGNLGVSQLGRVEYALNGGILNTDFIDNSAGVDCSDHEVNIKIVLNNAVDSNKITLKQRNKLLADMTDEVERLVLKDNFEQNFALSRLEFSKMHSDIFEHLIDELENCELLDPKVEFLPSKDELVRRSKEGESITRPELAILLSYSKMLLDLQLTSANLMNDTYFEKYLFDYFPRLIRSDFKNEILNHPLKLAIIRTIITNKVINDIGSMRFSSLMRETGAKACDVARSYAIICDIFDIDNIKNEIMHIDFFDENLEGNGKISIKNKIYLLNFIAKFIQRGISWFIRNKAHPIDISTNIVNYSDDIKMLIKSFDSSKESSLKEYMQYLQNKYDEFGLSGDMNKKFVMLDIVSSSIDIIDIAKENNKWSISEVVDLYFKVNDLFNLKWLKKACLADSNGKYWSKISTQSLKDDLYDKQKILVSRLCNKYSPKDINLPIWMEDNKDRISIFMDFVNEIKEDGKINFDMLILANKKFDMCLKRI